MGFDDDINLVFPKLALFFQKSEIVVNKEHPGIIRRDMKLIVKFRRH